MQVRAVTVGQRVSFPLRPGPVHRAARFASAAKAAFEDAGYEVQSLRLATQPISDILRRKAPADAPALARELEAAAGSGGVDYCSLGPVLASGGEDATSLIGQIPEILAATDGVFVSVMAATTRDGVNLATVRAAAEALVRIGKLDAEGAASRRFALTANVQPNGPFFPSAYHRGRGPGFSIAIEAADLAVEAFRDARDLDEAADALVASLERHGHALAEVAGRLERQHGVAFRGIDISPAPFPEKARSIGEAMELLGVGRFGDHGTLFASAFIVDILKRARVAKAGFSGLMIPLLEDAVMAARHAEGAFGIDHLLLYSAVCGTGLDTIPVPGDATVDQIAPVYLDLCALSVVLDKPLTARLMPMQGKRAGDQVRFEFPYFAPTTVAGLGEGSRFSWSAKGRWKPGG